MPIVYFNNGHSFGNMDDKYVLKAGEAFLPEGATPAQILAAFPHYNDPVLATSVLSQDIMAQFTVADFTAIKAAVASNDNFGLLWASLQAQKDAMLVTNARFKAGWSALVTVLGAPRMAAIAAALGVPIA
jgi:hypothetical protein